MLVLRTSLCSKCNNLKVFSRSKAAESYAESVFCLGFLVSFSFDSIPLHVKTSTTQSLNHSTNGYHILTNGY